MKDITYYRILVYILPLALIALMLTASSCKDNPSVIDNHDIWISTDSLFLQDNWIFNKEEDGFDGQAMKNYDLPCNYIIRSYQDFINLKDSINSFDSTRLASLYKQSSAFLKYPLESYIHILSMVNSASMMSGYYINMESFINLSQKRIKFEITGKVHNISGIAIHYHWVVIPKEQYKDYEITLSSYLEK